MASLAIGQNTVVGMGPADYMTISTNFNTTGRWTFQPSQTGATVNAGTSGSFGPKAESLSYGPWGVPGTLTLYNDPTSSGVVTWIQAVSLVQAANLNYYGTLTGFGPATLTPANANVTISPTGTGTVTINPATAGTLDNVTIGSSTRRGGAFTALSLNSADQSGTPGNVTSNNPKGTAAFPAAGTSVTVTNSLCAATSTVLVSLRTVDATLKYVTISTGAGSFSITGNAAATGITVFDWVIIGG